MPSVAASSNPPLPHPEAFTDASREEADITIARPHPDAKDVHVTGTFDDWGKSEQLNQVGDTWEKEVNLPSADEKYYYKFVVDDNWVIDPTAPQEDDGHFNINNVLLPKDIKRHEGMHPALDMSYSRLTCPLATPAVAANTAKEEEKEHKTPGAFPDTPANEEEQSFGVAPIPASSGIGNPVQLAPGEKVPESSEVNSNTVDSTATTSKEGYERDASAALPAVAGLAGAGGIAGMIGSAFSKPEEKKNLIPESSLPMGGDTKDTMDSGPHIQSAAPDSSTTALAAGVPLEKKRQAMVIDPADAPQTEAMTASGVPETVKESLTEAHQSPEAAGSAEVVKEKSAMEEELLKKTTTSEATGDSGVTAASQTSYYGLATEVPGTVEKSMKEAHAPPEAAADSSVVAEKSAMESELLRKVPSSEESGEPAPTIAAATSESAPAATTDTKSGLSEGEKIAGGAVGGMGAAGVVAALVSGKEKESAPMPEPVSGTAPVGSTENPAPTTEALSKDKGVASGNAFESDPVGTVAKDASIAQPETVDHLQDDPTHTAAEDPTLADEPAVKMMQQDEATGDNGTGLASSHDATTSAAAEEATPLPPTSAGGATTTAPTSTGNEMFAPKKDAVSAYDNTKPGTVESTALAAASKGGAAPAAATSTKAEKTLGGVIAGTTTTPSGTITSPSAGTTPAKKVVAADTSSPASSATKEKKKRNRLSRLYHKIVD